MYYDYKCDNTECKNTFEVEHGMEDKPEVSCPKCKSYASRVITGGSGVQFKGSGWTPTYHGGRTRATPSTTDKKDLGEFSDMGKAEDYTE